MHILQYWKIFLEVALLWYFIYMALLFVKGTRTEQLLKGLLIIGIIFMITQQLHLEAINWVLTRLFPISVIALLIIFQSEMRQGLARLGQFGIYQEDFEVVEEVSRAAAELSKQKTGALIAIEREVGLKTYIESGMLIDSRVTQELLRSIFISGSPLHDGAVIIQGTRLVAAGCLLPLAQEAKGLARSLGTRHRAALGLTEETDAVCIVVSEETGNISLSIGGRLTSDLDREKLSDILKTIFTKKKKLRSMHLKMLSRFSPKV